MKVYLVLLFLLLYLSNFAASATKAPGENNFKLVYVFGAGLQKDTATINRFNKLAETFFKSNPDSTIYFGQKSIDLSRKVNYPIGLADALIQVGRANYFRGHYDTASKDLDEAILIFKSLNNKTGLGKSYVYYGQLFTLKDDFKTAVSYLKLALEIDEQQKNNLDIADCYNHFGLAYFSVGKLSTALDFYYKALFICIKEHDNTQTANIYNNIGDVLHNLEEYPKALEYYKKALKEGLDNNDLEQTGTAYENIGELRLGQKNFDEALEYLLKAITIANKMDDKEGISYANIQLGLCYAYKNQFKTAKKCLEKSLAESRENKIFYDEAFATTSYGIVLNLQKDYKNALKYALKGKEMAMRIENSLLLKHAVVELYKSYAGLGQFETAFKYSNQYNELQDSLKHNAGIEKQTTYDLILNFNEKLQQIDLHQHEKDLAYQQKIKQQKADLLFTTIIAVIAIIALFYYVQKKRQQKTIVMLGTKNVEILMQRNALTEQASKLNDSNELKDLLIGILAHDFRAPLRTLNGLFYLLADDMITHDEMLAMIPGVLKQLKYTSDFLDTLLFWVNSQVENAGNVSRSFYLKEVVAHEIESYSEQAVSKGVHLFDTVPDDLAVFADADYIKITIRNLVGNALKFSSQDDSIEVTALVKNDEEKGEKFCLVEIIDTGIGMPEEKIKKLFNEKVSSSTGTNNEIGTGMAMLFCRDLIEKCKGKIWVTSIEGKGTQFNFTLPIGSVERTDFQMA